MSKTLIRNIGTMYSGDIYRPVLNRDSLIIENGKIAAIGEGLAAPAGAEVIDAMGTTVMPGLLDSHCHVVLGEWTPRQTALGWIDNYVRAGVTGLVSAGETHIPGKPKDAAGQKAMATLSFKTYNNLRPSGMKVYAGAFILMADTTEEDFRELAELGITHTGEIGLGSANRVHNTKHMIDWGHKYGIKFLCHSGSTYLYGSAVMDPDTVVGLNPDVICHVTYADLSAETIERFFRDTGASIEFCRTQCPNLKNTVEVVNKARERNELHRLMLGNDAPSGLGVFPRGIWEMVCLLSGTAKLPPPQAVACATGNTARAIGLKDVGTLAEGKCADLIICDAPLGGTGDDAGASIAEGTVPGVSMVLIDGAVMHEGAAVNTAPPKREAVRIQV
ncbi:amidohydrolase family protein [Pseudoflavonifractor sp. BIOML-A6]|nr:MULTISPECIES: amidohydrolase family protein [unclassified Pseudoflavonifractor]MTQ96491.1 amidohydrolase family protein [Pseudoflavonifractor sp. BIOML-A16]MTR05881.1 amidohydrolase family protein [Pseudoflavonifractor sp. BIOML-A15]MTR31255.1 amidohydrolase family protein [Pseudoflavonifractor sp. BIOML-A14]MTR72528.1 amidohydrolase family protein [Pseudoflavonifractor sp. BIOML-A18]MTS63663.1 amidohydrolase family protein [Pseudoflavonifractor sp. BIOML-A5]MTS72313.1 amidohydrolase famil